MTSSIGSADKDSRIAEALDQYRRQLQNGMPEAKAAILLKFTDIAEELEPCLDGLNMLSRFEPCSAPDKLLPSDSPSFNSCELVTLPDFEIVRLLGRGGMGVVYEAYQISLRRHVAVKILPNASFLDEKQRERFKNEAHVAALLEHPNIVSVHSVGDHNGLNFYVMQLVVGRNLSELLNEIRSDLKPDSTCAIAKAQQFVNSICSEFQARHDSGIAGRQYYRSVVRMIIDASKAVQYAHEEGVIHRDIKPANLLLDQTGRLFVSDFGLARIDSDIGLTQTGDVIGTIRYSSPEQAAGKHQIVDHRTDIYSLGVTLYELLTHRHPFDGEDRITVQRQIDLGSPMRPRRIDSTIPVDLETIVLKAIKTDPGQRYQTALDFAEDLQRFLDGRPIVARPASIAKNLMMIVVNNPGLATAVTVIALLTVTAIVFAVQFSFANSLASVQKSNLFKTGYANDMNAAAAAIDIGLPEQALELLNKYESGTSEPDPRGFEWFCLRQMAGSERSSFKSHSQNVGAIAISSDDGLIATGSEDTAIKIWEASTGRLLRTIDEPTMPVNCLAFINGRETLITGSDRLQIWNVVTGDLVAEHQLPGFAGNPSRAIVGHLAVSSKPGLIAANGGRNTVNLWRISLDNNETPKLDWLSTISGTDQGTWIQALAISPSGKYVALSSYLQRDNVSQVELIVYETEKQEIIRRIDSNQDGHQNNISSLHFSTDGQTLASGSWDNTVKLWNTNDWTCTSTLSRHQDIVREVRFLPNNERLISSGYDGRLLLWDANGGQLEHEFYEPHWDINSFCISQSGDLLATNIVSRSNSILGGTEMPGGANRNGGASEIRLWNPVELSEISPTRRLDERSYGEFRFTGNRITCLDFSPDGTSIGIGFRNGNVNIEHLPLVGGSSYSNSAQLPTTEPICNLSTSVKSLSYSAAGDIVDVISSDETSKFSVQEYFPIDTIRNGSERPAISRAMASGSFVATEFGGLDFQSHDRKSRRNLIADLELRPLKMSFSSDGTAFSLVKASGEIFCWSLNSDSASPICTISGPDNVTSNTVSNSGRLVVTGHQDGLVRVYDTRSGKLIHSLQRHVQVVSTISFTSDSQRIASGSHDGSVHVWDIQSGLSVLHLRNHEGEITQVAFAPDDRRLAVASNIRYSDDVGTLRIWQTSHDSSSSR